MTTRKACLIALLTGSLALVVVPFSRWPAADWVLAFLISLFPATLIYFAINDGRRRRLAVPLLLLSVALLGALFGMLALRGQATSAGSVLGLPASFFILLVSLWLFPFPVIVVAYIVTFDARAENSAAEGNAAP